MQKIKGSRDFISYSSDDEYQFTSVIFKSDVEIKQIVTRSDDLLEMYGFKLGVPQPQQPRPSTTSRKHQRTESPTQDVGPSIPESFHQDQLENSDPTERKDLLTETYRRPKRVMKQEEKQMHPLDEKRLLTQVKLEESSKREKEILTNMKMLLQKKQ